MTSTLTATNTSTADISTFYDNFQSRLLRDYVYGNDRTNSAIDWVASAISEKTQSVLDVGCGIGTTSKAYAARHSHIRVLGVDISRQNVETATRLCNNERIRFLQSDMTTTPEGGPFDLIAMVDVYEHIPAASRSIFHSALSAALAENGTVVLTTPSRLHQEWLAECEPGGLQIVDEIIDLGEIAKLADDLGATVVHHKWVKLWRPNQYCYTIMTRNPYYSAASTRPVGAEWFTPRSFKRIASRLRSNAGNLLGSHSRHAQVKQALGLDVRRMKVE